MSKWKKKHRSEWEADPNFKGWLCEGKEGHSYCKLCSSEIRAHHSDILKHARTQKHKVNCSKVAENQKSVRQYAVNISTQSIRRKEVILCAFIACHTAVRSVDHLTDIINKFDKGNSTSSKFATVDDLRLHRTKCSAILKNVLAPCLQRELLDDIGSAKFSLIMDESTDTSTEKYLTVNVKYYSCKRNQIVTRFVSFLHVVETTADELYRVVYEYFNSINLNMSNALGHGTDGANNMCGKYNSLFSRIRDNNNPNLVLVKCICHSLHLCASKASEVFSDEIDFLLRETYSWFSHSALRMAQYKSVYDLINIGEENTKFGRLTQLSNTRWLSRYRAVDKILNQFLELKTFFAVNSTKERCHKAKLLSNCFEDPHTRGILIFLRPILKQVYHLNLYFQRSDVDFLKAHTEINTLIWSLAGQILKPLVLSHLDNNLDLLTNSLKYEQNLLPIDKADLGYEFENYYKIMNVSNESLLLVREKCMEFIKKLLEELLKRMPPHSEVFQQATYFSPQTILNQIRPKFSELPVKFADTEKISDIEVQYRNLLSVKWADYFEEGVVPTNSELFWRKAITIKDAKGEFMFREISLFAFTMLSLPASNAFAERTFSIMNIIKCKIRNKMQLNLLNSIMSIKTYFTAHNICCKEFEPTRDMLSFNANIYECKKEKETDVMDECLEMEECLEMVNDF